MAGQKTASKRHARAVLRSGVPQMCAPWTALQSFKYKVKLVPGKEKKGKAVKLIKDIMMQQAAGSPSEKLPLKNLPDADMIRTVLSNIRLQGQGSGQAKGRAKGKKKK